MSFFAYWTLKSLIALWLKIAFQLPTSDVDFRASTPLWLVDCVWLEDVPFGPSYVA